MTTSRKEALLQLLRHDPSDRTSHYMLGNEYFKAQKYSEAVQTLRRYLQLPDNERAAYRLLAQPLERLGDLDGARRATGTASRPPRATGTNA